MPTDRHSRAASETGRREQREVAHLELEQMLTVQFGRRGAEFEIVDLANVPSIVALRRPMTAEERLGRALEASEQPRAIALGAWGQFYNSQCEPSDLRAFVEPHLLTPDVAAYAVLANECPLLEVECAIALLTLAGANENAFRSMFDEATDEAAHYFVRYARLFALLHPKELEARRLPRRLTEFLSMYRGAERGVSEHLPPIRAVMRLLDEASRDRRDWQWFSQALQARGIATLATPTSPLGFRQSIAYGEAVTKWSLQTRPGWTGSTRTFLRELGLRYDPKDVSDKLLRKLRGEIREPPPRR